MNDVSRSYELDYGGVSGKLHYFLLLLLVAGGNIGGSWAALIQGCSFAIQSYLLFNSNQFEPCRGYLRCSSVVGVKEKACLSVHVNWLASEKQGTWVAVDIPFFYFFGLELGSGFK